MLPLHNPEMISPVASNDASESPIVSQWQHLASMDRQSPDFLPLLSALTAGADRPSTTALRDNGAEIALGAMDDVSYPFSVKTIAYAAPFSQLFMDGKIPSENKRDTLSTMRTLAYSSGQIPSRYQVNRCSLKEEAGVIANGAFADVRKGRLGGQTVAIRTLRVDQSKTNHSETRKVRVASASFFGMH